MLVAEEEACAACTPMPCNDGNVKSVCEARFSAGVGLLSAHETRFLFFSAAVDCLEETTLTDSVLEGIVSPRRAASAESPSIGEKAEIVELLVMLLVRHCLILRSGMVEGETGCEVRGLLAPVSRRRAAFISSPDGVGGMLL